jgi:hypothetical protein
MTKQRRPTAKPEANGLRLLKLLTANLENARDAALRERLEAAIESLKERAHACTR